MTPLVHVASRRLFIAIEGASSSLGGLKRAAKLYALTTDPLDGLIGHIFGIDTSFTIPQHDLVTFGADPASRTALVDRELTTLLNGACDDADDASAKLSAMSKSLRTLLSLRFYALNAEKLSYAAEHLQIGLETVLEEYEDCAGERDDAVDQCSMAMDVLGELPTEAVFQATLNALLAGTAVPADASDAIEWMTDDCILPELDWLFAIEEAADMDEDDEEDEEEEDDE
jgi:hypothetical protein